MTFHEVFTGSGSGLGIRSIFLFLRTNLCLPVSPALKVGQKDVSDPSTRFSEDRMTGRGCLAVVENGIFSQFAVAAHAGGSPRLPTSREGSHMPRGRCWPWRSRANSFSSSVSLKG